MVVLCWADTISGTLPCYRRGAAVPVEWRVSPNKRTSTMQGRSRGHRCVNATHPDGGIGVLAEALAQEVLHNLVLSRKKQRIAVLKQGACMRQSLPAAHVVACVAVSHIVLDVHLGAALHEQLVAVQAVVAHGVVQRRFPAVVRRFQVQLCVVQQVLQHLHLALHRRVVQAILLGLRARPKSAHKLCMICQRAQRSNLRRQPRPSWRHARPAPSRWAGFHSARRTE